MARLLAGVPVTERRLDLAGVSTAVVEGGDGTPLVLLHGPGEFAAGWLPVFSDLVRTNRVIARTSPATAPRQPVMLTDVTTAAYDLVVGADGIHSQTRRLLPGGATTWPVMLGRGLTFLTIPIGRGQVYCYADSSNSGVKKADLASHFATFAKPVTTILASLNGVPVHRAAIEEVVPSRWVYGRVLLTGDAAHATSPNMAQGAAMAMEDGLVLVRRLHDTADVDAELSRFEQRRRARTDWVREQTHRRDHTRNLPPVVRNAALRFAGQKIFRASYAPLVAPP